jgi:hypothetical protein
VRSGLGTEPDEDAVAVRFNLIALADGTIEDHAHHIAFVLADAHALDAALADRDDRASRAADILDINNHPLRVGERVVIKGGLAVQFDRGQQGGALFAHADAAHVVRRAPAL